MPLPSMGAEGRLLSEAILEADMSKHVHGRFTDSQIQLDGKRFSDCSFTRCSLVYSGGVVPTIASCQFDTCRFELVGAAANTVALLKAMASPRSGMQELVRDVFRPPALH